MIVMTNPSDMNQLGLGLTRISAHQQKPKSSLTPVIKEKFRKESVKICGYLPHLRPICLHSTQVRPV